MSHSLYLACVYTVSCLYKAFTVPRYYGTSDVCSLRKGCIDLLEDLPDDFKRISLIIAVMLVKKFLVLINKGSLCSRRPGVDTKEYCSLCFQEIASWNSCFGMAFSEFSKFFFALKERPQILGVRYVIRRSVLEFGDQGVKVYRVLFTGKISSAYSYKELGIFRKYDFIIRKIKSLNESFPEFGKVLKRTAQERYLASNRMTAGKTGYHLIDNSLEY